MSSSPLPPSVGIHFWLKHLRTHLKGVAGVSFISMLTSLPNDVQERVMNFLVPFRQRQGHECPVIATGVASRKHRVWKIAGYHWWNLRAAQIIEKDTAEKQTFARLLLWYMDNATLWL